MARHQRVLPRRRPHLPHVLRQQPRGRGARQGLGLPRPEGAWSSGEVGGLDRGLPPDQAIRLVEPTRRVRRGLMSAPATTLRIERTYRASAEAVFDAWTSEEVIRRWWHAEHDWETTEAEV